MRIAGGTIRGRTLSAPSGDFLRPTQDAVREAVFSMLANVLPGSRFLDLYAGTGAVGLEAWSRGAKEVTWVEKAPRSLKLIERNLAACCGNPIPPGLRLVRSDVPAWVRHPDLAPGSIDIVYADPPYVEKEGEADGMGDLLSGVLASGILAPTAFFLAEQRDRTPVPECEGFTKLSTRRYGKTIVTLYRHDRD